MLAGGIQIKFYFMILILSLSLWSIISAAEYNSSFKIGAGYSRGQSDILLDTDADVLELDGGYELALKSIDIDGNKAYVELRKNGCVVDSDIIVPPNIMNGTYSYLKDIKQPATVQTIIVRFKNAFRGANASMVTIDCVWQASESAPSHVLVNASDDITITSGTPLTLEEGYELLINSIDIDGNKVYIELGKDGNKVDSAVIIAPNERDDTFIYSQRNGQSETSQIIRVHFKNALRGRDQNLVALDSVWQASESDTSHILINESNKVTITQGTSLRLEDGYELVINSVDIDGNKVYVELFKNGQLVYSKVIVIPREINDVFEYSDKNGQIIRAHFESTFRGAVKNLATIDNILQIRGGKG
jgi:predicted RNA-binding protein